LAVLLVLSVQQSSRRPATAPAVEPETNFWRDMVQPMMPWLLIFGFIWFFVFQQLRNQGRRLWKQNEDLQQPHVITILQTGLEVEGPKTATRFLWAAFGGWFETANLFILWQPNGHYTLIPKRVFAGGQQNELREIFRQNIAPLVVGFPVLPTANAPVVPRNPEQ